MLIYDVTRKTLAGTRKILIFAYVVIFTIENNTENTYFNIETGMVRATHRGHGQAIDGIQADNLPTQKSKISNHKSKRKAMNRNWCNQKANPALYTKGGNK